MQQDLLEQCQELGDVPDLVGEIVDEPPLDLLGGRLEGLVERPVRRDNPQAVVEHDQHLADRVDDVLGVLSRPLQLLDLLGPLAFDAVADRAVQEVTVHLALDEVGVRALAQGVDRHLLVGEAGDHDHRDVRGDGTDLDQGREAVAVGQVQVEQDRIERPFGQDGQGIGEPIHRGHVVPLGVHLGEHLADEPRVAGVVLDQQYPERLWVRGHRLLSGPAWAARGSVLTGVILAYISLSGIVSVPDIHSSPYSAVFHSGGWAQGYTCADSLM